MSRLRVVVLFGGRSVEREVSRISARTIAGALDPGKYEVLPIAVGSDGRFLTAAESVKLLAGGKAPEKYRVGESAAAAPSQAVVPAEISPGRADVVFPIIHGALGEDGALQGFLEMLGLPYVGAGVTGSAIGMDKEIFKRLLEQAGVPTPTWFAFSDKKDFVENVLPDFCFPPPLFVKPCNGGSSVGVSKVKTWEELEPAIDVALRYDDRFLIEVAVPARELECAVLGNEKPRASIVGEVVPGREFYDYDDKYREDKAKLLIPAPVPEEVSSRVRELSIEVFQLCGLSGMARVDFFLDRETGEVLVNELNTLPGFTAISMYPKLWEASGLPLRALLDELIRLALERKEKRDRLSHEPPAELA